ncbi:MAG TPA: glycosyltransferase family 4 protein [Candidatus Bathyarchaeia archaeon]|nr:glycosyltransferase family 4 protein [Candidatus Bathyarchaeia archaeon]
MKILIIQPWIKQGGAENISVYLAYYLKKRGEEVKITALFTDLKKSPPIASQVDYLLPNKRLSQLFKKSKLFFLLFGPLVLFWLTFIHSKEVGLLNPHNFPSCWVAVLVGKLRRVPVVWHCHEPPTRISFKEAKSLGWLDFLGWFFASSLVDKLLVKGVKKIIVPSKKTQKEVKQRYGRSSRVINLGVDFNFYQQRGREKLKCRYNLSNKFILINVGKLSPQKNQVVCLEAFKLVSKQISEGILVLIGEGQDRKRLRALIRNKSSSGRKNWRVFFTGFLSPEEVRNWYQVADINLFSPVNQSWGFTPIEALCCRVVSIVSDDCGVASVLKKERIGLVCPAKAKPFAENIIRVYRQRSKFEQMGQKGHLWVKKNLTWEEYAEKTLQVITG